MRVTRFLTVTSRRQVSLSYIPYPSVLEGYIQLGWIPRIIGRCHSTLQHYMLLVIWQSHQQSCPIHSTSRTFPLPHPTPMITAPLPLDLSVIEGFIRPVLFGLGDGEILPHSSRSPYPPVLFAELSAMRSQPRPLHQFPGLPRHKPSRFAKYQREGYYVHSPKSHLHSPSIPSLT